MRRTSTDTSPHSKVILSLFRWAVLPVLLAMLNLGGTLQAQNNAGNPWLVWYPEIGATGSDAPLKAFSINATTNKLKDQIANSSSYSIGNDLRGNIYYYDGTSNVRIIDARTKTQIGSFNAANMIQAGASGWTPHSIQGFYIAATNKHYIAMTGAGNTGANLDLSECTVAIFDVTTPGAVTLANKIVVPNTNVVFTTNAATVPSGGSPATRAPGMVLYQTAFTSAATKLFIVSDDGVKVGSTNTLGFSGTSIRHPSVWMDITDPLVTTSIPAANVHEVAYDLTAANAHYDQPLTGYGGGHQIAYDPTHDVVYITSEGANPTTDMNKILAFHATTYTPTYVVYKVGTSTLGSPSGAPSNAGYHGIQVNRAGTNIYTGRAQGTTSTILHTDEDRALRFPISATDGTAGSIITMNEAAASPSFSTTSGYFRFGVKTTNITPDEAYLYSATEGHGTGTGSPLQVASIWSLNPTTLAIVGQVQKTASSAGATFNWIDPHSYAFTLNDFGDAPVSYGIPVHNLANTNYTDDKLRIGATIDGETDPASSSLSNGDDLAATPKTDDEDGISDAVLSGLPGLYNGMSGTYTINNIAVKNTTANAATLVAWIDFNHNGTFESTEGISVPVAINATSVNLSWTIPANVTAGGVQIRLRLSTDIALTVSTPSTSMIDGEVEDYLAPPVTIAGSIWKDANSNGLTETSETAVQPGTIYANLVKDGIVMEREAVAAGTYSLTSVPPNTSGFSVILSTNLVADGAAVGTLTTTPPTNYTYTLDNIGGIPNSATPGTAQASSNNLSGITTTTTNLTGYNFGVRQLVPTTSFACTDGVSYMITENPSVVSTVDLKTGILTPIISAATLGNLNLTGLGYNPIDNLLYASISGTSNIVKIDANGTVTTMAVTGLPAGAYAAGDVGPTGIMYLYVPIATTMYKIDLNTLPLSATAMTVGAANVGDISITPNGQNIIAVSANTGNVLVWPIGGGNLTINSAVGNSALTAATFMDKTGDLLFIDAATSTTYEVPGPLLGVANSSTQRSPTNSTALTNTDGARCLTSSATPVQPVFTCVPNQAFISTQTTVYNNNSCSFLPGQSTLMEYDLSTGTITATSGQLIPDFNGRTAINNMGYNSIDNYLWAYRAGTNQLVRIGQDRSVEYFAIAGLSPLCPTGTAINNSILFAGDIDANGIMYLMNGIDGSLVIRVDLNPASPTYLTTLSALTLSPISPGLNTLSNVADLAISPIDGQLYNVTQNNNLIRISPTTGVVTTVGAVTGLPTGLGGYVVAFFDNAGSLYIQSTTPNIYQLKNVSTGGLVATRFSAGATFAGGDGARCPNSTIVTVLPSITGNILDDGNGLTDGIVNTSGTSPLNPINGTSLDGVPLYVSLVSSGTVIGVAAVSPTGSYTFTGIAPGTYSVVLSTTSSGGLTATLPASWTSTGENIGTAAGSDGTPDGILTVTMASTDVTNANLGINKKPVVVAAVDSPRSNPGGTTQSPVTAAVFSGSDQEDGTYPTNLTGRDVTLTPATNGTLYYNGSPVSTTTTYTNFDPTKVTLDPTATGATTGTAGAFPDPTFTYSVKDNAGVSSVPATVRVPFTVFTIAISGNVLDDGNGLTDGLVNTFGASALSPVNGTSLSGTPLYATLVNSGGTAVATVPVTAIGAYSFTGVTADTYSVVLSTNAAGSLTPSLPTSWTNTGENLGTAAGNDGTVNGILTGITVTTATVTNANFGIDKAPVVVAATDSPRGNPGGTATSPVSSTVFSGSDQEDGTYPTNLTGQTVTLTPATNGTLYYNGTPVSTTTTFANFDPTKVTIDPNSPGVTTGSGGAYPDPTFTYSVKDNAGVSSVPAMVSVPFTEPALTISGSVLDDGNGLTDGIVNTFGASALNPVNGTSLSGTPLYATLVNSGGTAVATVPVTASGTYSFTGVSPGTYSVVLSTSAAGSLTSSLPASWTNTGENFGAGAGNDGTVNGILTGVSATTASVTNANFGIDKAPVVVAATDSPRANPGGSGPSATSPVSSTVFSGNDQEDGTYPTNLTGRDVTLTPATNGTLYYNGSPVSTTTTFTNFDPTKVTLDPTATGATTGTAGAFPDPTFTYSVKDAAGVVSVPAMVSVPFTAAALGSISGTVFDDGNGLTDGLVNTFGGSALNPVNGTSLDGTPLYVRLVNSSGIEVAMVPVNSTGGYSFTGVTAGTYSVVLSTNPAGSLTPSLPTSWTNTGENLGTASGNDGTVNGILTGITVTTATVTNANFGIDKKPLVVAATDSPRANPGGTATTPVSSTVFSGTDQEDGTYPTNLTGRDITLSPATNGTLYYNGTPVSTTTTFANFDPTKVSLDPTATGATSGTAGASPDPTFTYSVKDNAGVVSLPATVRVPFTAPIPDVAPIIYALPSTQYGLTNTTVVVDVYELNNVATTGLITVYVSKDPLVSLSFNPASTFVGGRLVNNNIWTFDGTSSVDYYIFTTSTVISGGGKKSFGMTGSINPNGTQGTLTISSVIVGGSGGEIRIDNNSDADKIDYFKK